MIHTWTAPEPRAYATPEEAARGLERLLDDLADTLHASENGAAISSLLSMVADDVADCAAMLDDTEGKSME